MKVLFILLIPSFTLAMVPNGKEIINKVDVTVTVNPEHAHKHHHKSHKEKEAGCGDCFKALFTCAKFAAKVVK